MTCHDIVYLPMSAVSGKGSVCVWLFTKQGIVVAAKKCDRCNLF